MISKAAKKRKSKIIYRLSINLYNLKIGFGRCPKRGEGGSPTLSPFPGKGVFGKDAEIRTHQALHEAKPTECPKGDRDWGQALFLKNILFLQTELFIFLFFGFIKQNTTVSPYLLFLTISFLCCKIYVECGSNRFPLFSRWQRDRFSMQARQMILSGMNNGFILSKL